MCEVVVANFSLSVIFDAGTLRVLNLWVSFYLTVSLAKLKLVTLHSQSREERIQD